MQLIGRLNHPHIVRALNAGESEGEHFLAMEFVEGVTLCHLVTQLNAKEERIPIPVVCELVRQAALGLQNAHEFALVHRDIKPANLILDFSGTIKILDLGLGKFVSEKRSEDSNMMTQTGETMGTVDYMAPEQCENASTVDIRADIYSLGCTFYYLATGFPPYSGPRYDTVGKKLRAHMASAIPSLSDNISSVEPELERIFKKMMAKEPKHRFQTPQELADALEPFADAEMVSPFLEKVVGLCDCGKTIEEIRSLLAKSTKRAISGKKQAASSLFDTKGIALAILLTFLLGVMGMSLYGWRNPKPEMLPIQVDTAQMPGLNGIWWFEEIPWFTPAVREQVLQNVPPTLLKERLPIRSSTDVSSLYSQLWHITSDVLPKMPAAHRELVKGLKDFADSKTEGQNIPQFWESLLTRYQQYSLKSGTDYHTLAILQHRFATLKNDSALAQSALKSYRQTIASYQKEAEAGHSVARLLEILCLSDYARLVYPATKTFSEAKLAYEDVCDRNTKPSHDYKWSPVFLAEFWASFGEECAAAWEFNDSLFEAASNAMQQVNLHKQGHPLSAYIAERNAWSLMDQWKIIDAQTQFQKALVIRNGNNVSNSNSVARLYVLHNRHGIAMTHRYLGNTSTAIAAYREVLEDIKSQFRLSSSSQGNETEQSGRQLHERAANTRERLADCLLYGGAASGITRFDDLDLTEAAKLYDEAAVHYGQSGQEVKQRVMQIKAAIITALVGDVMRSQEILATLDELNKSNPLLGNQIRMEHLRQAAEAVLVIQQKEILEGHELLKQFLVKMEGDEVETDRRDGLEMRLFCAEMLLASAKNAPKFDQESVESGIKYLSNALGSFWGYSQSRPFKERYVDIIVQFATPQK